ncbi:MAG: rhodanese-like domain-containing protein [Sarcina sp.]
MSILNAILGTAPNTIDGETAVELIKKEKNLLIIDVRTKVEFDQGAIPKAINIPVTELTKKLSSIEKYKHKKILVYCASGMRSKGAVSILRRTGFTEVYNLKNGINSYFDNI